MLRQLPFIALCSLLVSFASTASDVEKEKRWADQIVDALIDGDAVWLQADEQEFLGIFTEAVDSGSKLGAIIAHGIGVHPDWQQVVHPLRSGLPTVGWHTLSLQMPILANDAKDSDYAALIGEVAPRLDAGVAFLKEQGAEEIVIIGHSLGSTMTAYYLSTGARAVQGFVAIGMPSDIQESGIVNAEMITKIQLPILDLYGSDDHADVLAAAPEREKAKSEAGGGSYASESIDGADHFFDGKEDALLKSVTDWLASTIVGG